MASALGIGVGSIVHTLAADVGLSAILAASLGAFRIVRIAGAAYLIYLDLKLLLSRADQSSATRVGNAAARLRRFFQSDPRVRVIVDRITGCLFVALGIRLAADVEGAMPSS